MDPIDVVAFARDLIDIDSTTGQEAEVGRRLSTFLRSRGWSVREQPVQGDRFNVLAGTGPSRVVLSTHFDCVPPFFPSREENGLLYGRGACDAKGILAAQLAAAERLRLGGEDRVGLLFVVGEERGSDGARAANALAAGSDYLVDGEPTDGRLGRATRGILRLRVKAWGRAAHSSYPQEGESAIEKLLDALVALRALKLPEDPLLGRTHYSVGLISGGVAPNVVPAAAEAEILFRTVGDAEGVRRALRGLAPLVELEEVLEMPPVRMHEVPGFETAVFPYTTDLPFLDRWGKPLLYGPGSVHVAHSADEHVDIGHLRDAVDGYVALVTALLASTTASGAHGAEPPPPDQR